VPGNSASVTLCGYSARRYRILDADRQRESAYQAEQVALYRVV